jgi:hypothetical protein
VQLARAFEVFEGILGAGLEGSIHAHRFGVDELDFTVTFSLVDRTEKQLAAVAATVERYDLELDVDDHRLASLT